MSFCTVYCKCDDCKDTLSNWVKQFSPPPNNPFLEMLATLAQECDKDDTSGGYGEG